MREIQESALVCDKGTTIPLACKLSLTFAEWTVAVPIAMMNYPHTLRRKAEAYARRRHLQVVASVGGGVNGSVWYTNKGSVIKAFDRADAYERERDVYFRLTDFDVYYINEFSVPRLRGFDEELYVIEMDTVQPPFVLDFAGAYLDRPPEFSPEVLAEQEERNANSFGSRWPRVRLLLAKLRSMGIYYIDIHRGNIRFPEFDDEPDSLD